MTADAVAEKPLKRDHSSGSGSGRHVNDDLRHHATLPPTQAATYFFFFSSPKRTTMQCGGKAAEEVAGTGVIQAASHLISR